MGATEGGAVPDPKAPPKRKIGTKQIIAFVFGIVLLLLGSRAIMKYRGSNAAL